MSSSLVTEIDKEDELISDEAKEIKITKEFQENVIKFVKLDDLIKKKQQEMSELKKKRKPCEEFILNYLDGIKENAIEITDGKLKKNKSEKKTALNQDIIKKSIMKSVQDPKIVEDIIKNMEDLRPLNKNTKLTRTNLTKKIQKK